MNDKNFIEELRQKREEYGVTQTRLAVIFSTIVGVSDTDTGIDPCFVDFKSTSFKF